MNTATIAKLGYSEQEILERLKSLGGATPENVAKVIAENNDLLLNQINTNIQYNIHSALEQKK